MGELTRSCPVAISIVLIDTHPQCSNQARDLLCVNTTKGEHRRGPKLDDSMGVLFYLKYNQLQNWSRITRFTAKNEGKRVELGFCESSTLLAGVGGLLYYIRLCCEFYSLSVAGDPHHPQYGGSRGTVLAHRHHGPEARAKSEVKGGKD